jgi:lactate dehydrogenase-like 2-hydroxyacid dehydrogenase
VLAPHIGSAERETREKMASTAAANVIAIAQGKPPLTPVRA